MSIVVKGLTKTFGQQKAIDQISFSIGKGEIVGFIGPNGAGKSTTMKIITGYHQPTAGEAIICDYNIEVDPIQVKKRIGYLPERNPLYLNMYVREYLHFIGGIYKLKNLKDRVEEVIDQTGLLKEANKKIGMLSKGYRQRVGLAQAIIHNPEILILDEPISGLDPNQLLEIRSLIKSLGKDKTVMFSSHILQEVEMICDRIIVINNGKIIADDQVDVLKKNLSKGMEVEVEFASEVSLDVLKNIAQIDRVEVVGDHKYICATNSPEDIRKSIFLWAAQNQRIILTLRKVDHSVEDIFQSLTQIKA